MASCSECGRIFANCKCYAKPTPVLGEKTSVPYLPPENIQQKMERYVEYVTARDRAPNQIRQTHEMISMTQGHVPNATLGM